MGPGMSEARGHARGSSTARAQSATRLHMSTRYLDAARCFSRRTAAMEKAPQDTSQFEVEHRAYAMGAIMLSVAFLEAAINELFLDANDGHLPCVGDFGLDKVRVLKEAWSEIQKHPEMLLKYRRAHHLLKEREIEDLENRLRPAHLLVKLRNELTHYKPVTRTFGELDGLLNRTRVLESDLPGLFVPNQLVAEGTPLVPDGCLGADGAAWAVRSAEELASGFFTSIGLRPNFMQASCETPDQDI
jgi:hypothetical protein